MLKDDELNILMQGNIQMIEKMIEGTKMQTEITIFNTKDKLDCAELEYLFEARKYKEVIETCENQLTIKINLFSEFSFEEIKNFIRENLGYNEEEEIMYENIPLTYLNKDNTISNFTSRIKFNENNKKLLNCFQKFKQQFNDIDILYSNPEEILFFYKICTVSEFKTNLLKNINKELNKYLKIDFLNFDNNLKIDTEKILSKFLIVCEEIIKKLNNLFDSNLISKNETSLHYENIFKFIFNCFITLLNSNNNGIFYICECINKFSNIIKKYEKKLSTYFIENLITEEKKFFNNIFNNLFEIFEKEHKNLFNSFKESLNKKNNDFPIKEDKDLLLQTLIIPYFKKPTICLNVLIDNKDKQICIKEKNVLFKNNFIFFKFKNTKFLQFFYEYLKKVRDNLSKFKTGNYFYVYFYLIYFNSIDKFLKEFSNNFYKIFYFQESFSDVANFASSFSYVCRKLLKQKFYIDETKIYETFNKIEYFNKSEYLEFFRNVKKYDQMITCKASKFIKFKIMNNFYIFTFHNIISLDWMYVKNEPNSMQNCKFLIIIFSYGE